jgi:hypothetical protein
MLALLVFTRDFGSMVQLSSVLRVLASEPTAAYLSDPAAY